MSSCASLLLPLRALNPSPVTPMQGGSFTVPAPLWIADISNWQAGLNVEQVIAEGYTAIVCKATEGTTYRDGQFDGWIRRIRAAGAIPGAYHFIRNGDGAAQARFFLDRLRPHGGPD